MPPPAQAKEPQHGSANTHEITVLLVHKAMKLVRSNTVHVRDDCTTQYCALGYLGAGLQGERTGLSESERVAGSSALKRRSSGLRSTRRGGAGAPSDLSAAPPSGSGLRSSAACWPCAHKPTSQNVNSESHTDGDLCVMSGTHDIVRCDLTIRWQEWQRVQDIRCTPADASHELRSPRFGGRR